MYEAPETGYARRWAKVYTLGKADYAAGLDKQKLYFMAHTKGIYGRIVMNIYPFTYISKAQLDKGIANDSSIYLNYTVDAGRITEEYLESVLSKIDTGKLLRIQGY